MNDQINDTIREIMAEHLAVPVGEIKSEYYRNEMDSLDNVEIMMAVEDQYNIEILDEEAETIVLVQDLVDLVKRKIELRQG